MGGVYIKIPTAKNLDKSLFARYISEAWTLNFSNPGSAKVAYITQEAKDVNQILDYYTGSNKFATPAVQIEGNLATKFGISG